MSDLYSECLVKKEPTAKDAAVKYGLIALIVVFAAGGLFLMPILLLGAVILSIVTLTMVFGISYGRIRGEELRAVRQAVRPPF